MPRPASAPVVVVIHGNCVLASTCQVNELCVTDNTAETWTQSCAH